MAINAFPITTVPATASNISYAATAPLSANNVQNAINELAGFIPSSVFGIIPVSSLSPPVLPNGSDQSSNLQAAIDSYTSTGVTLQFGAGTYIFNSAIVLKPNIILRGAGIDATILKAGVDNINVITRWGSSGGDSGSAGVEAMTLWGYADRNGFTQTSSPVSDIGPFVYYWYRNVKAIYSANMGLKGIGGSGFVDGCVITQCLRDGVNLTGTTYVHVTNSDISQVGDDAIAYHLANGITGINDCSIRVYGNRIEKCFGIKLLGVRNAAIANNVIRFYYGYGVFIGIDSGFGEGLITKFNVSITGNTILDGINANNLGGGNLAYGIFLLGSMSLGTGGTAIAQNVGQYNSAGQFIQKPDVFINKAGPANPRGPDGNISIISNDFRQTLAGMTNFSDAGFGLLWNSTGPINPAISTLIGQIAGISIQDDCENIVISGNTFHGVGNGIATTQLLNNAIISKNTFFRFTGNGISMIASSLTQGSVSIESNLFDSDPYIEDSNRTVPIDGTWTVTDGSSRMGIIFQSYNGVSIRGNRFRNCIRAIKYISGNYILEKNILEFDWSAGTRGISSISGVDPSVDIAWFCNSDPTSANFGKFDADFILANNVQPSAGFYYKGTFVRNNNPVIDGSNMIIWGWIRLTSGSAHVAGTDWAVARVSHVSPAT